MKTDSYYKTGTILVYVWERRVVNIFFRIKEVYEGVWNPKHHTVNSIAKSHSAGVKLIFFTIRS